MNGRQDFPPGVTSHCPREVTELITNVAASGLEGEYRRIASAHHVAIRRFTARSCIPASVTRVFNTGTKDALVPLLVRMPVDELTELVDEATSRQWFTHQLDPIAKTILRLNPPATRPAIHPGYKWGHATKVLALYVRDLVLFSRYFQDDEVERIAPFLFCPVDSIVIKRLRELGATSGVYQISGIESPQRFWRIQDLLGAAAAKVGVPRVWFDDNWGDRDRRPDQMGGHGVR